MKILMYAKAPDATELYRITIPAKFLKKAGHEVKIEYAERIPNKNSGGVRVKDVQWADIILFQRPVTEVVLRVLEHIKKNYPDKPVIADYDDDYYSVPRWNPGYPHVKMHEQFWKPMVKLFDGIITSTDPLNDVIKENVNSNVEVVTIGNGFDFDEFDQLTPHEPTQILAPEPVGDKLRTAYTLNTDQFNEMCKDRIVCCWAGSRFHYVDLDWLPQDINEVCKKTDDIVFLFVGYIQGNLVKNAPINRMYTARGFHPASEFYRFLKSVKIDMMLAPLDPCPFNRSKCLVAGSRIVTSHGILPIEELVTHRLNDSVVPLQEKVWSGKWCDVQAGYFKKNEKTIKLITRYGYEIEGTETHRVMTADGSWRQMKDIKKEDMLMLSPFIIPNVEYQRLAWPFMTSRKELMEPDFDASNCASVLINEEWGRLLGYILGDGHINGINRVQVTCTIDHMDILEDVERLFRSIGLRPFRSQKKDARLKKLSKGIDVVVTSIHLQRWLKHHNLIGSRGKIFRVPSFILKSPKSVIKEFLRGLFEADGYCCKKDQLLVGLTSKDRRLLSDVQFLLLGFGIKSKIVEKSMQLKNWNEPRIYYDLLLRSKSARLFKSEIDFISEVKVKKLADRCTVKSSNATHDWDWDDEVAEIVHGEGDVFDITVPDGSRYMANGFVNHNSNLKILEAMALHNYPVCSAWDPYEIDLDPELYDEGEMDTVHGRLVPYESGAWAKAIMETADLFRNKPELKKKYALENDGYMRATHDAEFRTDEYIEFFTRTIEKKVNKG